MFSFDIANLPLGKGDLAAASTDMQGLPSQVVSPEWDQALQIAQVKIFPGNGSDESQSQPGNNDFVPSGADIDQDFLQEVRSAGNYQTLITSMAEWVNPTPDERTLLMRRFIELGSSSNTPAATDNVLAESAQAQLRQVAQGVQAAGVGEIAVYMAALPERDSSSMARLAPDLYTKIQQSLPTPGDIKRISDLFATLKPLQQLSLKDFDAQWAAQSGNASEGNTFADPEFSRMTEKVAEVEEKIRQHGPGPTRADLLREITRYEGFGTNQVDEEFFTRIVFNMGLDTQWNAFLRPLLEKYPMLDSTYVVNFVKGNISDNSSSQALAASYRKEMVWDYAERRLSPLLQRGVADVVRRSGNSNLGISDIEYVQFFIEYLPQLQNLGHTPIEARAYLEPYLNNGLRQRADIDTLVSGLDLYVQFLPQLQNLGHTSVEARGYLEPYLNNGLSRRANMNELESGLNLYVRFLPQLESVGYTSTEARNYLETLINDGLSRGVNINEIESRLRLDSQFLPQLQGLGYTLIGAREYLETFVNDGLSHGANINTLVSGLDLYVQFLPQLQNQNLTALQAGPLLNAIINRERPPSSSSSELASNVAHAVGTRDFNSLRLAGMDLQGADLRGARLRGADLQDADLRGADLRGAEISVSNLLGVQVDPSTQVDARIVEEAQTAIFRLSAEQETAPPWINSLIGPQLYELRELLRMLGENENPPSGGIVSTPSTPPNDGGGNAAQQATVETTRADGASGGNPKPWDRFGSSSSLVPITQTATENAIQPSSGRQPPASERSPTSPSPAFTGEDFDATINLGSKFLIIPKRGGDDDAGNSPGGEQRDVQKVWEQLNDEAKSRQSQGEEVQQRAGIPLLFEQHSEGSANSAWLQQLTDLQLTIGDLSASQTPLSPEQQTAILDAWDQAESQYQTQVGALLAQMNLDAQEEAPEALQRIADFLNAKWQQAREASERFVHDQNNRTAEDAKLMLDTIRKALSAVGSAARLGGAAIHFLLRMNP